MTDRYVVIGNPVGHSKSPWIHAEFARATGQDIEYGRLEPPLDGFDAAVDRFRAAGGRGANVTLPFKPAAFRYCVALSRRARAAEAVNTLVLDRPQAFGDNTDGVGLVRDLQTNLGCALEGRRVLLLGAGGAAQGVVQPLLDAGVVSLIVVNRTAARAETLAARFPGITGGGYALLEGAAFDLVINATSSGLADERPPIPGSVFAAGALAYDMVYGRDTPFLALARAQGVRVSDGTGMLVEQAAESFFVWRGVRPPTASVLRTLRRG
ncbi:MAG TPA: shikimate dehydrogenase [Burkholderiales bacterium]|nr:shikimate dehydrogenase [Burkholderiales bacterium]